MQSQLQRTGDECQIVNLGCGFDTLYWRLRDAGHMIKNFVELDFPTVTARKCFSIKRNKTLLSKLHVEGERTTVPFRKLEINKMCEKLDGFVKNKI